MKTRYKLHWASGQGPSPELKWQIWDWTIYKPIAHLENRKIGREICLLLNAIDKYPEVKTLKNK